MAEVKEKKGWSEKIKELRTHHQSVLEVLGVPEALFIPKMFYKPPGKEELHISFFMNELQRGQDIYTEMVDRDCDSEDPHRILYKWVYNELWATQYEKIQGPLIKDPKGFRPPSYRYLVPVSELEKVVPHVQPTLFDDVKKEVADSLYECTDGDCPISDMTMLDLVAIWMKAPVSNKEWLNAAIRKGIS